MKILKIKVGEVFIDNKNYPVFQTAFEKLSKDKKTKYYQITQAVFVQECKDKPQDKPVVEL